MIAMQYQIALPDHYDMNLIRQRVRHNGTKTDGFEDLLFKAYLIRENQGGSEGGNEYSPLYLWKDSPGMIHFIWDGYYDNIVSSFGRQRIKLGIPLFADIGKEFLTSRFVLETEQVIPASQRMVRPHFSAVGNGCTGKVLICDPEQWVQKEYSFFDAKPDSPVKGTVYELLHLSV